jgi:hypothetical protein
MTVSRMEFESVVRELQATLDQHASEHVQFERSAQMQAELDLLRMASEPSSRKTASASFLKGDSRRRAR